MEDKLRAVLSRLPSVVNITPSPNHAGYDVTHTGRLVFRIAYDFVYKRGVDEIVTLIEGKL